MSPENNVTHKKFSRRTLAAGIIGIGVSGAGIPFFKNGIEELSRIDHEAEKVVSKVMPTHPSSEEVFNAKVQVGKLEDAIEFPLEDLSSPENVNEILTIVQSDELTQASAIIQQDQQWDNLMHDRSAELGSDSAMNKAMAGMMLIGLGATVTAASIVSSGLMSPAPTSTQMPAGETSQA